jgi:hypothetical protein
MRLGHTRVKSLYTGVHITSPFRRRRARNLGHGGSGTCPSTPTVCENAPHPPGVLKSVHFGDVRALPLARRTSGDRRELGCDPFQLPIELSRSRSVLSRASGDWPTSSMPARGARVSGNRAQLRGRQGLVVPLSRHRPSRIPARAVRRVDQRVISASRGGKRRTYRPAPHEPNHRPDMANLWGDPLAAISAISGGFAMPDMAATAAVGCLPRNALAGRNEPQRELPVRHGGEALADDLDV